MKNHISRTTADTLINQLVDYVYQKAPPSAHSIKIAKYCLWDSLSCALASLSEKDCLRMLGPIVPGTVVPNGVPVIGTDYRLDPVKAAFDISAMIRWMDFNDTSFAGGHPSDSIGAIISASYYKSQILLHSGQSALTVTDVLTGIVQAYEIQGMLSFANKFDQPAIGLDHVLGVKIACSVVLTKLLGGTQENAKAALGNSWMDGGTLNAYRHVPNAGPRKSWAGADAASRALWHALQATRGEPGYLTPLSNPQWGFEKVFLNGKTATITNTLNSFVVENIIFKFYPCQRNVSTALEAAIGLYPFIQGRLHQIKQIRIHSHDEAIRRTDKKGPLLTRAARDHCLQYIVAVGLFRGTLELDDYLDTMAKMPEIDFLREKMILLENPQFSQDHHNISIRSCANAIQIELQDGQLSDLVQVDFPKGDPIHRDKVENAIIQKFHTLTRSHWSDEKREKLIQLFQNDNALLDMSIIDFMHTLVDL